LEAVKTVDGSAATDETSAQAWQEVLDAVDHFGQLRVRADELNLNLPEWFLTVVKDAKEEQEPDADVMLPSDEDADGAACIRKEDLSEMERGMLDQLQKKSGQMKELLQKLLAAVRSAAADKSKAIEYAHILQEKRAAVAGTLSLKGQLQAVRGDNGD
jgi:hypothetical protein